LLPLALAVCFRYDDSLAHSKLLIFSQTPLIALQAAMPLKDMAMPMGAFGFLRYAYLVRVIASIAEFVI